MPYPPASTFSQTTPETGLDAQRNPSDTVQPIGGVPNVSVGNAHTAMATGNEDGTAKTIGGFVPPEPPVTFAPPNGFSIDFTGNQNGDTVTVNLIEDGVESQHSAVFTSSGAFNEGQWTDRPGWFTPDGDAYLILDSSSGQGQTIPGLRQAIEPKAGEITIVIYKTHLPRVIDDALFTSGEDQPVFGFDNAEQASATRSGYRASITRGASSRSNNLALSLFSNNSVKKKAVSFIKQNEDIQTPNSLSAVNSIWLDWDVPRQTSVDVYPVQSRGEGYGDALPTPPTPPGWPFPEVAICLFAKIRGDNGSDTYISPMNSEQAWATRTPIESIHVYRYPHPVDGEIDIFLRGYTDYISTWQLTPVPPQ